jgi:hypothetical protein
MTSLRTYIDQRNLTPDQCRKLWQKRHPATRPITAKKLRDDYDTLQKDYIARHEQAKEVNQHG